MKVLLHTEGTWGDVLPFVFLASALNSKGCNATIATNEYYFDYINSYDVAFQKTTDASFQQELVSDPNLWKPIKSLFFLARANEKAFFATYEALSPNIEDFDLVIGGIPSVAAKALSQEHGLPYVGIALTPMYARSNVSLPVLPNGFNADKLPSFLKPFFYPALDSATDRLFGKNINSYLRNHNLETISHFLHYGTLSCLTIGLWPEWYVPIASDQTYLTTTNFPIKVDLKSDINSQLLNWISDGPQPFIATLGSSYNFSDTLRDTLREVCYKKNTRCIFIDSQAKQEIYTKNFAIIKHTSLSKLLPMASTIIHHGGTGTIAQAIAAGIPQIISPMANDQADNAAHVVANGLGKSYSYPLDGGTIYKALNEVDNTEMKHRCEQASLKTKTQGDGIGLTADLIIRTFS